MSATKKLTGIAVFAALAFVISFLEFPIFPQAGFLKLDFSLVIITLGAFVFGYIPAVCISGIKELLCFLIKSSSGGVGELSNFVLTVVFITLPCLLYRYKKGIWFVILYFFLASILQTAAALPMNRFVNFPLYMGSGAKAVFDGVWQFIIYFNLIKTFCVSILTILFYKRLKNVIMKI